MKVLGGFHFEQLSNDLRMRLRGDPTLNQRGVSDLSGVSEGTISKLLNGKVIGVGPVLKLCRMLDESPYTYLDGDLLAEPGNATAQAEEAVC